MSDRRKYLREQIAELSYLESLEILYDVGFSQRHDITLKTEGDLYRWGPGKFKQVVQISTRHESILSEAIKVALHNEILRLRAKLGVEEKEKPRKHD